MHVEAATVQRVPPGVSLHDGSVWCLRCGEPHDPDLHFDRCAFDRASFRPSATLSDIVSRTGFRHSPPAQVAPPRPERATPSAAQHGPVAPHSRG